MIDWDQMTILKNVLDEQGGIGQSQQKVVTGLAAEAADAWRGAAGQTWNTAVEDWLRSFNDVLTQLHTITVTIDHEVAMHIAGEDDARATAAAS